MIIFTYSMNYLTSYDRKDILHNDCKFNCKTCKEIKITKRHNVEKETFTQSYHFNVDRKWQFGGVVRKSKQIPHIVAGIMSAPTPDIVKPVMHMKRRIVFILNRIKGNHLELAYILRVLCCHCRRSQGWGLRLFVIMCGAYVPSYLLAVCPVPHVNFFLVNKWSPEFGSRRSELVSSLMNAYS